ncbi:hypothetical protein HDU76_000659 [Blyttiomyces sp. JEL0837]|nr:hypothetical protein HDU76_000659 [Blyttiomyces sp. JEL0837]
MYITYGPSLSMDFKLVGVAVVSVSDGLSAENGDQTGGVNSRYYEMMDEGQLWYLLQNQTTIEAIEKSESNFLIIPPSSSGSSSTSSLDSHIRKLKEPYDLGWYRNICAVLGPRWYLWWCPGIQSEGDGYHFPVVREKVVGGGFDEFENGVDEVDDGGEAGFRSRVDGDFMLSTRRLLDGGGNSGGVGGKESVDKVD